MININLIAERRERKLREENILRKSAIGLVLLLVAIVVLNGTAFIDMQSSRRDMNAERQRLTTLKQDREALAVIESQIAEKGPIVDLLRQVRVSEGAWMVILADLSRVIPADAALANLHTQAKKEGVTLRLTGRARDEETVGAFMMSLSQHAHWAGTPELGNITDERSADDSGLQVVRFDFSVPVRGMLGGEL